MIAVNPTIAVDIHEPSTEARWCKCDENSSDKCFTRSTYFGDGECDCGVEKHHYHGGVCGGITQIG